MRDRAAIAASDHGSIDRDVFQAQMVGVAEEMSRALRRAAYSPIIWDMHDYSCAIFSPKGEMLAQAATIPAQLGTMATAFAGIARVLPVATWAPGDMILCNNPYQGCTHTPDLTLFNPLFHNGAVVAVGATIAHHIDVGGRSPGTTALDNTEIFAEGLVIPPVKLVEGGVSNDFVFALLRENLRSPMASLGDLRAQMAGCRTAERRIAELAGRYGAERFRRLSDAILDYGERYTRGVIARLPDGLWRAETRIEDGIAEPEPILLAASVEVNGDSLAISFAGSSGQRRCALNCPWSSTVSMAHYAARAVLAPDLPQNGGFDRAITVSAPQGTVLNPGRPAAVSSRHFTQQAVADVVLKALAAAAPATSGAGSQIAFPVLRAEGRDDRLGRGGPPGRPYLIADILGGGMGATAAADGLDAVDTHGGNCALLSAEVMETMSPLRVLRSALVPGSGGDGEHRGGLALEREYELLAAAARFYAKLQQATAATAPWGYRGGGAGGTGRVVVNAGREGERLVAGRDEMLTLARGDRLTLRSAGGGGFGEPSRRSLQDRQRDLREGYVACADPAAERA